MTSGNQANNIPHHCTADIYSPRAWNSVTWLDYTNQAVKVYKRDASPHHFKSALFLVSCHRVSPARTSPCPPDLLGADSELHTSVLVPFVMMSVGPFVTITGPSKSKRGKDRGETETGWESHLILVFRKRFAGMRLKAQHVQYVGAYWARTSIPWPYACRISITQPSPRANSLPCPQALITV